MSGIDKIVPKHDTAKWVGAMAVGVILTLVVLNAAGVFDKPAPQPAAAPPTPPPVAAAPDSGTEPAPPPPPEPAAAPPPRTDIGTLVIRSSPPVEVRDGEENLGKTPLTIELPPGEKKLRLTNASRFIDVERTFKVKGGATDTVSLSFPMGTLRLDGPAGAKVSIDGRPLGALPIAPFELVEGKHRLDVKYQGAKMQQQLTVVKDRELKYSVGYAEGEPPK